VSALAGTRPLAALALRLDRNRLVVWIVVVAGVVTSTAAAFADLYPTLQSRQIFAISLASNPGLRALTGPPFDLTTIGGLTAWRTGGFGAVLVAVMSLLGVVRHTRAEEEAGRLELVGSGAVGRRAPMTACLLVVFAADLALAMVLAAGLVVQGQPLAGSLALGLAFAGAGWMFGALAAVTAQLSESARAASGMAVGAVGLSYLLRAAGDAAGDGGPSWLSWLSPIGWTQQVRPFAHERWWVFALILTVVATLVATAYALVARRDLGAGLLPSRPGPAHASPRLRSPLALAWRLQRGSLLGWSAGCAIVGGAVGAIAESVGSLLDDNPQLQDIVARLGGPGSVVDAYLASVMRLVGMVAAAYAVQATLRLRAEETSQRAEPMLAAAVTRIRWVLSHVAFAALGPAVLLACAGVAAGLAHGIGTGDVGGQVPRVLAGALVQIPAAWVLAGLALACFGLAPRLAVASWAALIAFLLIDQLGEILQLDPRVLDVSPFTHVPKLPGADPAAAPLLSLTAIAAALAAAGLAGVRQRDIG
jgi:ABC-2 type transport system permease protein